MKPSCWLIGSGTLLQECLNLLLSSRFQVMGVITSDEVTGEYGMLSRSFQTHHSSINYFALSLESLEKITECDYLFSIVNPLIIPEHILQRVQLIAINYHDSLLPKHAGTYASTWAIINEDKLHGITWHEMNERIDSGDILLQKSLDVAPRDTTFSLNLKCYEAAVESFPELLNMLIASKLRKIKQNIQCRSYHPLHSKPYGNGFLNLRASCADVIRLVRALDFGLHANPFASPKIVLNNELYVITQIADVKADGNSAITINDELNQLEFPLTDGSLIITELQTLQRNRVTPRDLQRPLNTLLLTDNILSELQARAIHNSSHEQYWLSAINSVSLNSPFPLGSVQHISEPKRIWELGINVQLLEPHCRQLKTDYHKLITATLSFYLLRLMNYETVSLKLLKNFDYIFSKQPVQLPLNIHYKDCDDILRSILEQVETCLSHGIYEPDLFCRYPDSSDSIKKLPVLILFDEPAKSIEHFGLMLRINKRPDGVLLSCYLNQEISRYPNSLLHNMPVHLENIFKALGSNLTTCSMLAENELAFLRVFNRAARIYDNSAKTLLDQILENCSKKPDAVALVEYDRAYSYYELSQMSNNLAHSLKDRLSRDFNETPKQQVIAIHCSSGLGYVLSILAVMRLGCIYVPIDSHYPEARVQHIIKDSGCIAILSDGDSSVETNYDVWHQFVPSELNQAVREGINNFANEDLLYLMYTSGSTGEPKGVKISHANFSNLIQWYARLCLSPQDKTLIVSSVSFDLSQKNFIGPLVVGGAIYFLNDKTRFNSEHILSTIKRYSITHLNCITGVFLTLIENESNLLQMASLKNVVLGVGLFSGDKLAKLCELNPDIRIHNSYGPAECTDVCSCYTLTAKDIAEHRMIPIGKPIDNCELFIVDIFKQLLPMGIIGSLAVAGKGVGQGYLNREQLSAQVFTANTLDVSVNGGLLYNTGDHVYFSDEGKLYFVNRKDNQVKYRGLRVELGEIEARLNGHMHILESAVINYVSQNVQRFIAFVVPSHSGRDCVTAAAILDYLKEFLPGYMLPHEFVFVTNLPRNHHLKIDREQLLRIISERDNDLKQVSTLKGLDVFEEKLIPLWEKILGAKLTSIDMHFFKVGGDSLLATKLATRIATEFEIPFKTLAIYQNPTFKQLAAAIKNEQHTQKKLNDSERSQRVTVSEQQAAILHLDKIHPEWSSLYNSCYCFHVVGSFNLNFLQQAFTHVLDQMPLLRANFHCNDSGAIKRSVNPEAIRAVIINKHESITNNRFDLAGERLLKLFLLPKSVTEVTVYIVVHHCISDAESIDIICRQVSRAYSCLEGGEPLPIIKPLLDYNKYIAWQQAFIRSKDYHSLLNNYVSTFHDLKPTPLPYDQIPMGHFKIATRCEHFTLSVELEKRIISVCDELGLSRLSVLWSVVALLISKYMAIETLFAGTYVANRYPSDYEETIGIFSNMMLLRADINPKDTIREFFTQINEQIIAQLEYQSIPTLHIIRKLKIENQDNTTVMIPLGVEYIGYSQLNSFTLPGCRVRPEVVDFENGKFNLCFSFYEHEPNVLKCRIEYNQHMFGVETILRIIKDFECCLVALMSNLEAKVEDAQSLFCNMMPSLTVQDRNNTRNTRSIELAGILTNLNDIEKNIRLREDVDDCACVMNNGCINLYIIPNTHYQQDRFDIQRSLPFNVSIKEIFLVTSLPYNESGNIDYERLVDCEKTSLQTENQLLIKLLTSTWKEKLNLSEVNLDDNFFKIGGDSLIALDIVACLEKEYGIIIRLNDFFQFATLRQLVNYIDVGNHILNKAIKDNFAYEPIIKCNRLSDNAKKLFCVHPGLNHGYIYKKFAENFSSCQFYAVNSFNYYHDQAILDLKLLASYYLEALLHYQPTGPYYLAGWSLGGTIAYEMAQQLKAQQREVACLYLFDSFALDQDNMEASVQSFRLFANLRLAMQSDQTPSKNEDERSKLLQTELEMLMTYQYQHYDGKILLFKANRIFSTELILKDDLQLSYANKLIENSTNGFDELCSNLLVLTVDCDHHHILSGEYGKHVANIIEQDMILSDSHHKPLSQTVESIAPKVVKSHL